MRVPYAKPARPQQEHFLLAKYVGDPTAEQQETSVREAVTLSERAKVTAKSKGHRRVYVERPLQVALLEVQVAANGGYRDARRASEEYLPSAAGQQRGKRGRGCRVR